MNGFFNNLLDRHLGICETIQPRSLGRFENDKNSSIPVADKTAADITEAEQTVRSSAEPSITNSPTVNEKKADFSERKSNFSSLSYTDKNQENTSTQSNFSNQKNIDHYDSKVLPERSQITRFLDSAATTKSTTEKRNQTAHPTLANNNKTTSNHIKNKSDTLDKVIRNNNSLTGASNNELILDSDLNLRMQTMLQHLTKDRSSAATPDSQFDLNKNESLVSISPETKISKLNSPITSPEVPPVTKRKVTPEENNFSENKHITSNQSQLVPEPLLTDIASQLTQRLQGAELKTDPVINVTIGRVEVRAVHADAPRKTRQTKKPTGVMTLDDYLKRRENRGSK